MSPRRIRSSWGPACLLVALCTRPLVGCAPGETPSTQPVAGPAPTAELAAGDPTGRRLGLRERLLRTTVELDPDPPREVDLARGRELYGLLCQGCHGRTGTGRGAVSRQLPMAPPDMTDARQAAFFPPAARLEIIRSGSPGTPMVGWGDVLDPDQLRDVFQYVRSFATDPGADLPAAGPGR